VTPKVGEPCSFYHETGRGDSRVVHGWRYGILREVPIKGQHKGWARIEVPVHQWGRDEITGKYVSKPNIKVWVHISNVNAPGDTVYHGPTLKEVVAERKEEKAAQQAKADKQKAKARRFHR
jgi:hypothetical protein